MIDWLRTWLRAGERVCGMEEKEISIILGFLLGWFQGVEKSIFPGCEILKSSNTNGYLSIQFWHDLPGGRIGSPKLKGQSHKSGPT